MNRKLAFVGLLPLLAACACRKSATPSPAVAADSASVQTSQSTLVPGGSATPAVASSLPPSAGVLPSLSVQIEGKCPSLSGTRLGSQGFVSHGGGASLKYESFMAWVNPDGTLRADANLLAGTPMNSHGFGQGEFITKGRWPNAVWALRIVQMEAYDYQRAGEKWRELPERCGVFIKPLSDGRVFGVHVRGGSWDLGNSSENLCDRGYSIFDPKTLQPVGVQPPELALLASGPVAPITAILEDGLAFVWGTPPESPDGLFALDRWRPGSKKWDRIVTADFTSLDMFDSVVPEEVWGVGRQRKALMHVRVLERNSRVEIEDLPWKSRFEDLGIDRHGNVFARVADELWMREAREKWNKISIPAPRFLNGAELEKKPRVTEFNVLPSGEIWVSAQYKVKGEKQPRGMLLYGGAVAHSYWCDLSQSLDQVLEERP